MQKTDRQVEELVAFAKSNRLNFDESTDIYKDIISGFKDGEDRPNFSILMAKLEMGEYTQVLFSEFSRLERKPTNLLRDLEKFQSLGFYAGIVTIMLHGPLVDIAASVDTCLA